MCLLDGPAPLDAARRVRVERLDEAARERELRVAGGGHAARPRRRRRAAAGASTTAARRSRESTAISEELGLRYMAQWSKRSLGRLELAAGDPAAAERALRESWEVLTEMGLNSSLGETAVPLAEALYAQGATTRPRRR